LVLWHLAESKQVALFFEAFASQLVFLYLVVFVILIKARNHWFVRAVEGIGTIASINKHPRSPDCRLDAALLSSS
jgi:hypothetical protein